MDDGVHGFEDLVALQDTVNTKQETALRDLLRKPIHPTNTE